MAKDGTIQAPKPPIQSGNKGEADRYLDQLYDDYEAGRITFSDAYDLYSKKYGAPDFSRPPTQMVPEIPPLGKSR